jgi:hypothetical protein
MRRLSPWVLTVVTAALVGCGAGPPSAPDPTTPVGTSGPAASTSSPAPPAVAPSPVPPLPAGLPPSFEDDVPAAGVPTAALVPLMAQVTGAWYGFTSGGEAIVVAWQMPGADPFRRARGIAAWRRFDDGGDPWRPVWGTTFGKGEGVVSIQGVTADVSADDSDDAVLFAGTSGSGGCGMALVVDLLEGRRIYERALCDARLDPSTSPTGLRLTESVFAPGDAHCCPSAVRTSILTYDGRGWTVASSVTEPT